MYTDLASNDFSVLFRTMQGMQGDKKFAFQKEFPNVFVHGCGTGFHEQLLSNNSLSLGFSATAMHYVSERPCLIKDHVHMVGAKENEKNLFKQQALKDWEKILLSRSKELISGGRFICINFGIDEKGRYLGNTGAHNMFDNFAKHWKSLETKNIISKDRARFARAWHREFGEWGDRGGGTEELAYAAWSEMIKTRFKHHTLRLNIEDHPKYIKEKLSSQNIFNETIKFNNQNYQIDISLSEIEESFIPLVDKTIQCVKNALNDANLSIDEIDGVIMVGGSTRMPTIQNHMKQFFNQDLLNDLNPDEVVAIGAARQAFVLSGQAVDDDTLLLDVTPLSLGIETMGDLVERIIPRNSTIPIAKAQEFTTYKDGQTMMKIHVVQGEREKVSENRSLGEFVVKDIPPMPAGAAKIKVTFQVDADSLLTVSAEEQTTGTKTSIEIKPSYSINENEIRKMLEDSFTNAEDDKKFRSLAELIVDANQILELTEKALHNDQQLLSDSEKTTIEKCMNNLKSEITKKNPSKIKQVTDELNNASMSFAQKRMDRSIHSALTGKNINEINK